MNNYNINNETLPKGKKIYFSSDLHLGAPDKETSAIRERKFVNWLDSIKDDVAILFLVGDIFDFWFEYKTVIPKGFTRLFGKLAEISDTGVQIHYFVGNHDLWMLDYFQEELKIIVHHKPKEFIFNDISFLIGHGDGLGPDDYGYKRMKKVFTSSITKFLYRWLHPDIGMKIGQSLSLKNKLISGNENIGFIDENKEWLVHYCRRKLEAKHRDHFIFGHRHLPLEIQLNNNSKYTNLGDWITHFTYGVFDGVQMRLEKYT